MPGLSFLSVLVHRTDMGTLSIVATPIGNLEDITLRALRTLREANVIYAEDTRVAAKLLSRFEITVPVRRLDAAVEAQKVSEVVSRLEAGERVAYITDAGTPGISDPGGRLVARVRELAPSVKIEAIPGPSAITAALSIAGVSDDEFLFLGFLPHKKGRKTAVEGIVESQYAVVLYESPHRIEKLLRELKEVMPKRAIIIGRELTKMHEELLKGIPAELEQSLGERKAVRGEFVVIIPTA